MIKIFYLFLFLGSTFGSCAQNRELKKIPLEQADSYANSAVTQGTENLTDGNPQTRYHPTYPAYTSLVKPFRTTFLLSDFTPCVVKKIVYRDGNGDKFDCKFYLRRASDGKEIHVFTFTGDRYQQTVTVDLPVDKQFAASALILQTPQGGNAYPDDLELWGSFGQNPRPIQIRHYPIKNFLGANLHPWDIDSVKYPAKYRALVNLRVTLVRLYSNADSNKDSAGAYKLNPQKGGFQPERSLASLKKDAPWITAHICYQNQSLAIKATWAAAGKKSHLNFPYGADRNDPETYSEIAHDLFVLATRGGHNKKLPDYTVYKTKNWWEPKQSMIKGGGFYDIIEGGNEWNAWWAGLDGYLSGPQLAAAWSAMYDGDKGEMKNAGVKTADKQMMFSNGGVASDRPDILFEVIDWSRKHRGTRPDGTVDLPFDVYQFHCYPSAGGQYSNAQGGLPPEVGMIPRVENIVRVANKYGGGVPTLVGEWGYDVHPESPQNAPAYGPYSAEQSRAHLAIRAILGFAQAGAWGAEWYRLYQDWPNRVYDNVSQQFATMALLRQMDDSAKMIKRTLVGDYFKQLSAYDNFVFKKALRSDSLRVLKFSDGKQDLYAIWAVEDVKINKETNRPVYTERKGKYNLDVKGKLYRFVDDGTGRMAEENFSGGTVAYDAKPVFIITGR